jgi:hypothetical protein
VIARAATVLFAAAAPGVASASPPRPAVALTVSPAHVTLVGAARRAIRIANTGAGTIVVDLAPAGFALGPRGRPRILLAGASARRAASWLGVRPNRLALAPGTASELVLVSKPPRAAAPGDHPALVLVTTRASPGAPVAVRMRVGITVLVRVPGRIRHALVVRSLHARRVAHRQMLELVVANVGNVVEWLRRGRVEVSLVVHGRVIARLDAAARELLPRSTAVFDLPYRAGVHGDVTAVVALHDRVKTLRRSFRVPL